MKSRILLVEDDARLRAVLALNLERRGHQVATAALGAAARAELEQAPRDILVLDINLPDETGWEVLRWLRRRGGPQPRVVVLTAVRPPQELMEQLAPDAVLTKPFPIDALTRLVDSGVVEAAD